ncbi:MAG: TolC family protein [Nannocystaceae bacterium]
MARGPDASGAEAFAGAGDTSFELEPLSLSEVLKIALDENIDLRSRVVDISISETTILSAVGAYDVRFTAGVDASYQRNPARGSQFALSTGSRSLGGQIGLQRKLETGGSLRLEVAATRSIAEQPISFIDPSAGSVDLASYRLAPALTLTHPLLRGLGIRVNRASVHRARLATSQSEALELDQAQLLVRDLVHAYWDVLFAKGDLANKRRSVELSRRQLDRTLVQVSAGRLAPVDAKSVEQRLATGESEVLVAEYALMDRSLTLRTLMGQKFADRVVLGVRPITDPTDVRPELLDPTQLVKRALASNPQVRQLGFAIASRRVDELEAANNRLPQLDFSGSFSPVGRSVDSAPNDAAGVPGERGSWAEAFGNFVSDDVQDNGLLADFTVSGSLSLTWDIQNRTADAGFERTQLELEKAELNLERVRQTTGTAVLRAVHSLRTAVKRMQVERLSVELAQQNLSAEQARFEVGRSTNYDVLQRIDAISTAESGALSAHIDYLKGLAQLQTLTGEILPALGLDLATYGR